MPPEKKSFQNDLLDDRINEITEKLKTERPKPLSEILKSEREIKNKETLNIPVKNPETSSTVKSLRTYQSDVADAVQAKQESVVSISIAEKKRSEERGDEYGSQKRSSNPLVIAFVSLLLIGGGAYAILAILTKDDSSNKPVIIPKPESIIGTNKDTELTLSSLETGNAQELIRTEVDRLGISAGTLGNVRIVETAEGSKQISAEKLLALLKVNTPGGLSRSIKDFMIGAYGRELGAETFILFETNSFELAFSGMLAWEKTLASDLQTLFPNGRGVFKDAFIKNRDVRALRDENGIVKILYSFLDSKTFVIAGSEDAFLSVLNQFNTGQVAR